jgi:hypothetical protein
MQACGRLSDNEKDYNLQARAANVMGGSSVFARTGTLASLNAA